MPKLKHCIPAHAAAAVASISLLSPGASMAAESVVVTWNAAALQEVRLGKLGPPIVARALAVAHTCMYDAWAAYDPVALPVASTVPRRPASEATAANKNMAVSHAAYRCLLNLFPAGATRLGNTMRSLGFDPNDTQTTNLTSGAAVGNSAAAAVIASRRNDGSNQYGDRSPGLSPYADYTGYVSRNAALPFCQPTTPGTCALNISDPLSWQPLVGPTGSVQTFIAPHWGNVRGFALASADQFDGLPEIAAGPRYRQSPQLLQADIDQVIRASGQLTAQQKLIVEYWADGPESELPPGHWGLLAQHVARRDFNSAGSLDRDVKMFFAMHNASFDAGIVAWYLKRKWDGVRPITAVRFNKQGQSIFAWGGVGRPNGWIDGGKWSPYNPGSNLTPAFPGWISGHSIFSASSAAVLRGFTGSDALSYTAVIPPNFGRVEPGIPAVQTHLSYASFTAAANDAAASRLLGGIHFNDDNQIGLMLGDRVGQQAWQRAQQLFDGGIAVRWEACAVEGGNCTVPSARRVRYGANGLYAYREISSTAPCNVPSFGYDPVFGVRKSCDYEVVVPQRDSVVAFEPVTLPGYKVRHSYFLGYVDPIGADQSDFGLSDSRWLLRRGLGDSACLSFESTNYPGHFLRHAGLRLRLDPRDGSAVFNGDATFCPRGPLTGRAAGGAVSLEAKSWPGYYLTHANDAMYIAANNGTGDFASAATFFPVNPRMALSEGTRVAMVSATKPGYRVQHRNFLGWMGPINGASSAVAKDTSSWIARPGLARAGCRSFESLDWPGYYLRHADFRIRMDARDGSALFDQDATFCARPPLTGQQGGQSVSLESINYPGYFLRELNLELVIAPNDHSAAFSRDATFVLSGP